jgi:hypothetical protein
VIPVEQEHMAVFDEDGDNVQRGDCLRACVASIFELPLADVPHFVEADDWLGWYTRWVRARGFVLGTVRLSVGEENPLRLTGHPTEGIYWIATVKSPRSRARCGVCGGAGVALRQWLGSEARYVEYDEPQPCVECDATGLVPPLHAVVMCGGELAWDPHPLRDMGHGGWISGQWFIAADPAAFIPLVSENGARERSSR